MNRACDGGHFCAVQVGQSAAWSFHGALWPAQQCAKMAPSRRVAPKIAPRCVVRLSHGITMAQPSALPDAILDCNAGAIHSVTGSKRRPDSSPRWRRADRTLVPITWVDAVPAIRRGIPHPRRNALPDFAYPLPRAPWRDAEADRWNKNPLLPPHRCSGSKVESCVCRPGGMDKFVQTARHLSATRKGGADESTVARASTAVTLDVVSAQRPEYDETLPGHGPMQGAVGRGRMLLPYPYRRASYRPPYVGGRRVPRLYKISHLLRVEQVGGFGQHTRQGGAFGQGDEARLTRVRGPGRLRHLGALRREPLELQSQIQV